MPRPTLLLALILGAAPALSGQEPQRFAPEIMSDSANNLTPAFAPDSQAVWFTIGNGRDNSIVTAHRQHGRWTKPIVAEFSGRWRDLEAAMAPDGSYLIFASNRPVTDGGAPLDGDYGGAVRPGRGGNLWRVDRRGTGWSTPVRLSDAINATSSVFSPSIVADGSLYFMKASPATGRFQIYRSQFTAGRYEPAQRVAFSDEEWSNVDATIAPDESFAVFSSNRPPTANKDLDLFLVFHSNGVWGTPVSLGPGINSPTGEIEAHLAPDGHTLFFGSDRTTPGHMHIWHVDIAARLAAPRAFMLDTVTAPNKELNASFTPDGQTVYCSRSDSGWAHMTIYEAHGGRGGWSAPTVAPFSGRWKDTDPAVSPDGRQLYFASNRPATAGDTAITGYDLWVVDRDASGAWGAPRRLDAAVNAGGYTLYPSVTRDGTLYFARTKPGERAVHLYRARRDGDHYAAPVALPFTSDANDFDGTVSSDDRFIVFTSRGRGGAGGADLFVSFRHGAEWTAPANLGLAVNSAQDEIATGLSPDHRTLYFASNRDGTLRTYTVAAPDWGALARLTR